MHGKKIVNNGIISVVYIILMTILTFVTRKIFVIYIGEELLGLNSLYANLLDLLNLADLGIGVAVQYKLYEPLVHNDYDKLSRVMVAAKKIYNSIGCFILIAGVVLSLFINCLITETSYSVWYVRSSFLISVVGVALGYFFVHKRLFLTANEEIGLVNVIDLVARFITVVGSLISIVMFKNYFLYLAINALYGLLSNIIIHLIFKYKYPRINTKSGDVKLEISELTSDLKNVIPMKLSNYVYNSTDNVIISKVLGLTTVALYSNYMTIINGIMGIEYLFGNIVTASMGKIIKEIQESEQIYQYYLVFQYAQYIFTSFCTVSLAVLCNPFITWWIGDKFIVESGCFILLVLDFFIHSMYQPAYVMFGATGKFKEDKYITIVSAVINIVMSIILVLRVGLSGVIIGTLLTDIYIWMVRTYQMVKGYFSQNLFLYCLKMLKYCVCTLLGLGVTLWASQYIVVENVFVQLILRLIICCIIPNCINWIITCKSEEAKMLLNYFRKRSC